MALTVINNIFRILFLILLQNLVVNRMQPLDGLILPWIYIFGILMLPFETPRWLTLLISFAVGWIMDFFSGPPGLHTSACLLLGFLQPLIQRLFSPREGYEINQRPTVQSMGLPWYLTYAGILTLIHHTWLFFMEVLRFSDFFYQLLHIVMSVAATLFLMTIGQYLIYTSKNSDQ
ncbi:MAG: rod shape-determining protein MreD [Flavobacteriales bacterium]|jgi:cell shape-determining protein MreD